MYIPKELIRQIIGYLGQPDFATCLSIKFFYNSIDKDYLINRIMNPPVERGIGIQSYIKKIKPYMEQKDGQYIMPDVEKDFERFGTLHSWYKHLVGRPHWTYPVLWIGEEPRYEWDPRFSDKTGQKKLHWRFVIDYVYKEYLNGELPYELMYKYNFQLSNYFGSPSEVNEFHKRCAMYQCQEFWNELISFF